MKVTVITVRELTPELAQKWSQIQDADPHLRSPYFCVEFTQAVAAVRPDVRVAILHDAGNVVGFFPFQRRAFGQGIPVGGPMSDCHGVIGPADLAYPPDVLVRACGLKSWTYNHLPACQSMFQAYHEHRDVSPLVDLSTGYEAYRSDRQAAGSRVLTETARKDRKLAREVAPVEFSPHVADASVLGQVMAWKSEQYRRTGLVDLFGFRWARELVERIMHTSSERFSGMLSVLRAGDRLVAAHMGMRSLGVWHWWFPTYDHEYARYSPGAILLMRTIERACESGLSQVDLGKGDDEYKQRFANAAVDLAEGSVIVGPWRRAMRTVGQRGWQAMRRSPLRAVGRAPARVLRRVRRWWALR